MGPELLGDAAWRGLFSTGSLNENPGISMTISTRARLQELLRLGPRYAHQQRVIRTAPWRAPRAERAATTASE